MKRNSAIPAAAVAAGRAARAGDGAGARARAAVPGEQGHREGSGARRPNVFRVDLDAVDHNLAEARRLAGPSVRVFAALKADAYGFGLEAVAERVVAGGAEAIAVADLADARRLRERGIEAPILLYPGHLADAAAVAAVETMDLMPTLLDAASAEVYAAHSQKPIRIFVKVDVGLERLGVAPEQALALVRRVCALPGLVLHGLYTHVDVPAGEQAEACVDWQLGRYRAVCAALEREGIAVPIRMAASSAVLRCAPDAAFDAVDPGHMLFGLTPPGPLNVAADLKPAFRSLSSRLIHTRTVDRERFPELAPFPLHQGMRYGVIPIGLRDGMAALTCGEVLVGGRRVPILGPFSLEHTRVDLSEVPGAAAGDEVVIIGRQGEGVISPDEVIAHQGFGVKAALALAVGTSVPRVYG